MGLSLPANPFTLVILLVQLLGLSFSTMTTPHTPASFFSEATDRDSDQDRLTGQCLFTNFSGAWSVCFSLFFHLTD